MTNHSLNPVDSSAQLRRIVRLPADQRAKALLQQPDVSLLIRCMPAQDLLIAYQMADDPQHRTALIQHMPPGQMQRLWDLDVWAHHRIQPQQLTCWLQTLCDAGVQSLVNHLQGLDFELLHLLFKLHVDIYDQYQWESMDSDKTLFAYTPDRAFVLVCRDKNETIFACLRQFVEMLYGENPGRAMNLLLNVIATTPSTLEEQALHWRDTRMQDLGFLPISQWQDVLAYINPHTLAQQVTDSTNQPTNTKKNPHLIAPRLQLRLDNRDSQDLLKQAIAQLDGQSSQHVAHQLLVLTNRVHAAWHKDLGNEESLTGTTRETLACLQMALQYLQQAHNKPASHWLLCTPLQRVFQLGRSLPVHLAKQLQKSLLFQHIDNIGTLLHNLETPYSETLQGLLRKQPAFFQGLAKKEQTGYEPFEHLQQLAHTAQIATEAAFRLSLLWGKQGIAINNGLQHKQARQVPKCNVLFATWLAWALLEKEPHCKPLPATHLCALKNLLTSSDSTWAFTPTMQDKAFQWVAQVIQNCIPLPGATNLNEATIRAEKYARTVLDDVAQEIGSVADANVDPRFVQTVWTMPEKSWLDVGPV